MNTDFYISVRFNNGIPHEKRGPLLLAWEKLARQTTGLPIEVFTESMADDSKLRVAMQEKRRRDMTQAEKDSL